MKIKYIIIYAILLTLSVGSLYAQSIDPSELLNKEPSKLYIGAVLESNSLNKNQYEYPAIGLPSITVSYSSTFSSESMTPSYQNMMNTLKTKLQSGSLKQNQSFSFNIQEVNQNGKELNKSFGQEVDLATYFGKSSSKKIKKTRALINIYQIFLSMYMDAPANGFDDFKAEQATWDKYNVEQLIYVNTVNFGRKILIMVDSDVSYTELRTVLNVVFSEQKLTDVQKIILQDAHIRIIAMGSKIANAKSISPLQNAINYLKSPITAENFMLPVSFSSVYIKTSNTFINTFSNN